MKQNYMQDTRSTRGYLKRFYPYVFVLVLFIPGVRQPLSSLTQSAVLKSGFLDAAPQVDNKETFDFNFKIKDLSGNKIEFESLRGKVIFLNLWATWCAPCRSEMPAIQSLYDGMDKENISFVMLSLDKDTHIEKVRGYVKEKGFTFPIYMPSGFLADQLQVPSIPTTFVISKDGKIAMKEVGMKNYNTTKFKNFLKELEKK